MRIEKNSLFYHSPSGENISLTLFYEKPDDKDENENDESILKLINPVVARLFYGENIKAFAAAIVAVKSPEYKVESTK